MQQIVLPSGLSGLTLKDPDCLIKKFVDKEYALYDAVAVEHDDELTWTDVELPNKIGARRSKAQLQCLLDKNELIKASLRQLGKALELTHIKGEHWEAVERLFEEMCSCAGIGLAVATKILHKKRPGLIPIMDGVFQQHYKLAYRDRAWGRCSEAEVGVHIMKHFRRDFLACEKQINELSAMLQRQGTPLTPVRILEVLIWMATEPMARYRERRADTAIDKAEKLEEAEYFLRRIKEANEDDQFKYNLSGFLSAHRSVMQYMYEDTVSEYRDKRDGKVKRRPDPWYSKKMDDPILKYLRDKRDLNIHKRPIQVRAVYNVCSGPQGTQASAEWYFRDWSGCENAAEVCEEGLKRIQTMVAEGRKLDLF